MVSENMGINYNPQWIPPQQQKQKSSSTAGATCAAIAAVPVANRALRKLARPIGKEMVKTMGTLPSDTVIPALDQTLESSGLAQKGVKIIRFTPQINVKIPFKERVKFLLNELKGLSFKDKLKLLFEKFKSPNTPKPPTIIPKEQVEAFRLFKGLIYYNPIIKFIRENITPLSDEKLNEKALKMFKPYQEGRNACFVSGYKSIILPKNLDPAGFHEMGHALNKHTSTFWRSMQRCQVLKRLALPIGLIAAFTNKAEAKNGEQLSTGEKVKNTIRDNAGKLAFACWIPTLLEEAKATINGNELARKVLSPEMAQKVAKGNKLAWLTYLAVATATGLAAWLGVKIKDSLSKDK